MGIDKYKALNNKRRISEKSLILSALFFGGVGSLLGMIVFRHKIRKIKFVILIPISGLYTLALTVFMVYYLQS